MTTIKRFTTLLAAGMALSWAVAAAEFEGVLMDKMCSAKAMEEGGHKAAAMHKLDCALMPDCVKSGYGIVTADNKFLALDAEGNKKAEAALRSSQKTDNIRAKVTGTEAGDAIKVKSLKIL